MKEDAAPSVRVTNQGEVDGGDGWKGSELPGAESLEGPGAALQAVAVLRSVQLAATTAASCESTSVSVSNGPEGTLHSEPLLDQGYNGAARSSMTGQHCFANHRTLE